MRITIEPTATDGPAAPTVIVSVPHDDLSITDVKAMVRGALIAYGFAETTVDDAFGGAE